MSLPKIPEILGCLQERKWGAVVSLPLIPALGRQSLGGILWVVGQPGLHRETLIQKTNNQTLSCFLYCYLYVSKDAHVMVCRGQRTTWRSQFSPTMWVLEMDVCLSSWL